jgi:diguanylate cyclase (GGDEF)-like protein
MRRSFRFTLPRSIGTLAVALGLLIGGTWLAVKMTTDHLLYQEATSLTRDWARYIAESVTDLEAIAAGEQPSTASMAFIEATRRSGQVFRWEIFNPEGYSQLVADRNGAALVDFSEFVAEAARSVKLREPIIDVKEGQSADYPSFFGQAYVPVIINGHPIAVVAAYVDQTEMRNRFKDTFLLAAGSLSLVIALAFGVPAIGWYWRSEQKLQGDERIRFLAHHDALTGLTNRARLVDELESALADLHAQGGSFALHFIDLDRFKDVNDTLGHDGGDHVLRTTAERLRAMIQPGEIAARLGGDEFVVIQRGVSEQTQAADLAGRIIAALTAPIAFKDQETVATASVGVALAPVDGNSPERLLKCADLALYKAKSDGRHCVRFFQPDMDVALQNRLAMEKTVRDALLHERFVLHYQPIFEVSGQRLIGFEALLRLRGEDGVLIPPMAFIPIAEDMRVIDRIGAWALREACRTAVLWPEPLTIAVNLSPAQFAAGGVSAVVADALAQSGLMANRLELEITENLLLDDSESVMAELQALRAMETSIVLDDFGIGYSSLSYLWRFPFSKLKIDRSFMQAFDNGDGHAESVVKTIIALARELNMRVTVEGVETVQQLAFLSSADADQAQGFLFGRPVPAETVSATILRDFQRTQLGQAGDGRAVELRLVKS